MEIANAHVNAVIRDYIERYEAGNGAARRLHQAIDEIGIGLRPLVDHLSIRTLDVAERCLEFTALGFSYDDTLGVLERDSWWARVFRKPGFPAIYIDQPFNDHRGSNSTIRSWVERFGDGGLHHIAVSVDHIETAMERMQGLGITFTGAIIGDPLSEFRQIYTEPEVIDGVASTTLELIERRWGFTGFLSTLSQGSGARE